MKRFIVVLQYWGSSKSDVHVDVVAVDAPSVDDAPVQAAKLLQLSRPWDCRWDASDDDGQIIDSFVVPDSMPDVGCLWSADF